jgi:hypothetical protein
MEEEEAATPEAEEDSLKCSPNTLERSSRFARYARHV